MLVYGPSGALSEYEYKGGVFHGVHYGDFHEDSSGLFALMEKEEAFLLKSPQKRRILFDLYHTDLTAEVLSHLVEHISNISPRIFKIAFAAEPQELRKLKHIIKKTQPVPFGLCKFDPDQDTDKTWLVSDEF